jgi:3-oxoacyl-[acyl-carrier protein] reductase
MLSSSHRPGLLGAFKTLARKLAGDGITLNTILPGRIATSRLEHLYGSLDEAEKVARDEVPAGRLGRAEEIGAVAAFLCSEEAGYVTAQALAVDGGLMKSA